MNEALRQKFLDLKEGAIVVSLKCLMGSGRAAARERSSSPALKERNVGLFRSFPPSACLTILGFLVSSMILARSLQSRRVRIALAVSRGAGAEGSTSCSA